MDEHWHPTDGPAFRAVELVMEGNCASQIAKAIYDSDNSTALNRVKQLLKHATKQRMVKIRPPVKEDLQIQLAERFPGPSQFHVVNNDHHAYVQTPEPDEAFRSDAVCRKAAEVLARRIHGLLMDEKRDPSAPIIVANAGGLTVSRVVHFLDEQKHLPVLSEPSRITFISLNSAAMPADYNRSANVLAVRMAQIYGGDHMALSLIWPVKEKKEYEHAVRHIDLLLCGAGAEDGLLFQWLEDYANITLPTGAVGDICLIPITAQGDPVPLEKQAPKRVREVLNPHPTYPDLQTLASRDGIIFVAVGSPLNERRPDLTKQPPQKHPKLAVTRAILEHTLARTCILGTTLARDLLEATKPSTPPSPKG